MRPRLLPSNGPLVQAWGVCASTQWRLSGMGLRSGLDYAAVRAALEIAHPRASPGRLRRFFAGIRVIEAALLRAQREWFDARAGTVADGR
jgi:hypothetical protein